MKIRKYEKEAGDGPFFENKDKLSKNTKLQKVQIGFGKKLTRWRFLLKFRGCFLSKACDGISKAERMKGLSPE